MLIAFPVLSCLARLCTWPCSMQSFFSSQTWRSTRDWMLEASSGAQHVDPPLRYDPSARMKLAEDFQQLHIHVASFRPH